MSTPSPSGPSAPRFLDLVADALRTRGYVAALRQAYVDWARRYILFHNKRHPKDMGAAEVGQFLDHVAAEGTDVNRFALAEARDALTFVYAVVVGRPLEPLTTVAGEGVPPLPEIPRFLDQMRHLLRVRHYARRTEDCYVDWARRYILFHDKRHPMDLRGQHVEAFLIDLAVRGHVAASTQNQMPNALVFLYKQVLEIDLGRLRFGPATRPARLPVVLSRDEVRRVLESVAGADGVFRLMADLLYGAGLRRLECCRLRVKAVGRGPQARRLSHVPPQLRDAPARTGVRRIDGAKAVRPQGREHDHDLPARHGEGRRRGQEPARFARRVDRRRRPVGG